jgi:hypothetical protein
VACYGVLLRRNRACAISDFELKTPLVLLTKDYWTNYQTQSHFVSATRMTVQTNLKCAICYDTPSLVDPSNPTSLTEDHSAVKTNNCPMKPRVRGTTGLHRVCSF